MMNFKQHRKNLVEWIYFAAAEGDFEHKSRILILADKEDREIFTEALIDRVDKISTSPDGGKYDYVIIPSLSRRLLMMFNGDIMSMYKALTEKILLKGGKIITGFNNVNDIDLLAGEKKDRNLIYISYMELMKIRKNLELEYKDMEDSLYFPMPNLNIPINIYSSERWPSLKEENEKIDALIEEGVLEKFVPSYLYIFKASKAPKFKSQDYRSYKPIYIKYNSSRKSKYAIKTMIMKDLDGVRHVIKKSLSEEANDHVEALVGNVTKLSKSLKGIRVLKEENIRRKTLATDRLSSVQYPFIAGRSLASVIAGMIENGRAPIAEMEQSISMLTSSGVEKDGFITPANYDCLFSNVIIDGNEPVLIDCEWVVDTPVEKEFLKYRILRYWYEEYKSLLRYTDFKGFLREFSIMHKDMLRFEKMEEEFQRYVHGDNERNNEYFYEKSRHNLANFLEMQDEMKGLYEDIELLKNDIKTRDITIKREREHYRLTNIHVANLENVIKTHEKDIGNLQNDLRYSLKHQSIASRTARKLKSGVDRKFPEGTNKRKKLKYVKNTLRHPGKMISMYTSNEGRNLISGDFKIGSDYLEHGKLVFPKTDKPLVSIIIPCYNQINYTYRCLASILKNTEFDKIPYEVIIADDVSTDATKDIRLFCENLVIARNKENQGFLKNCNQAAKFARGKYIYFLNNDTVVKEHYLSSLISLIESSEQIGMVGSKLVYPDGRLQEAGGIIWADGSGWNYGRLDDPSEPQYNYVKEVDYISGASILLRTDLWNEIGGFDERFAPAYYEDTDLAFEIRKRGKRVLYQPESVIVHYEGISNGTDTEGTGLKKYQKVNLSKFKEKWKEELKNQFVNDGNPDPYLARERGKGRRYMLFVEHYVPTWDKDAGSKLDFQYIRLFLSHGFKIKFLTDNFHKSEPYTSILEQMGVEVLYGNRMQRDIWDYIKKNKNHFNIAYLNRPHIASKYIDFIRSNTDIKVIYFGHDLHSLRLKREYELYHDPEKLEESQYWKNMEFSVMRKADISYFPSIVEEEIVKDIDPGINVKAITAFIYGNPDDKDVDYADREGLLFVGGFRHPPNKDAVVWFINEIFPKVRESLPDLKFRIAGSHADEEILELGKRDGVEVLGFVSDEELSRLYDDSRIVVVPLRYGAGVKGKIIEALYKGSAIVTTNCGAEGIPEAEKAMLITDDAKEFADDIIRLYTNMQGLAKMSLNARDFIRKHYSPEGAWDKIKDELCTDFRTEECGN